MLLFLLHAFESCMKFNFGPQICVSLWSSKSFGRYAYIENNDDDDDDDDDPYFHKYSTDFYV